jgi:hypothetical protein
MYSNETSNDVSSCQSIRATRYYIRCLDSLDLDTITTTEARQRLPRRIAPVIALDSDEIFPTRSRRRPWRAAAPAASGSRALHLRRAARSRAARGAQHNKPRPRLDNHTDRVWSTFGAFALPAIPRHRGSSRSQPRQERLRRRCAIDHRSTLDPAAPSEEALRR